MKMRRVTYSRVAKIIKNIDSRIITFVIDVLPAGLAHYQHNLLK
jgi:hypothetical protein